MRLVGLVVLTVLVGCGDNAQECGPATVDVGGVCTPNGSGSTLTCGAGTMFDPASDACVPASDVCGDGTVLIGGMCQDPNAGVTVDLEEGPEPNGFEPGAAPAGVITLAAVGDPHGFVIHGCVTPVGDAADFDRYELTVAGPTLIDVTAAGVDGLAAGFVALGGTFTFERFGLDLASTTSEREVYLPQAGTYSLAITASSTLLGVIEADQAPPAGNADGTSCYYVTLQQATPAPAPFALAGTTGPVGGALQFFAAAPGELPNGFIDLTESIAANEAVPSLQIFQNGALRTVRDGGIASRAEAVFGGILPADDVLVVVDDVYDYAVAPASFTLGVRSLTTAQPLPVDGSAVPATTAGTSYDFDPTRTNLFYLDTPTADNVDGLALALSVPMEGAIVDADFHSVVDFGGLFGAPGGYEVVSSYQGLLRTHAAGRYYLALYGPASAVGTSYTVTSTFTRVVPIDGVVGVPSPSTPINAFDAVPITFDTSHVKWSTLDATGTNTGDLTLALFDPGTAYGRLGSVALFDGTSTTTSPGVAPVVPPFGFPGGVGSHPYILADLVNPTVLATVSAAAPVDPASYTLRFGGPFSTDLGTLAAGQTVQDDTATSATPARYYIAIPPSSVVGIDVTPFASDALTLQTIAPDQSALATSDPVAPGAAAHLLYTQDARGYTALAVSTTAASSDFELTVTITYPYYVPRDASALAFTDVCASGSALDITPLDTDEGITAPILMPPGFTFYGATAAQAVASTNGFLSFDTALANAAPNPGPLPIGGGDVNIAPYWQDLDDVRICTQTLNGTLVVQWIGETVADGTPVQFEVVLDPASESIQFVFGPDHAEPGTEVDLTGHAAVQGVESPDATQATTTGDGSVAPFVRNDDEPTRLAH